MTALAQLRETLARYDLDDGAFVISDIAVYVEALRELLALKEAGALIIVPDEKLLAQAYRAAANEIGLIVQGVTVSKMKPKEITPELAGHWSGRIVGAVLDALRDAKPQEDATCDQPPMGCDKPRGHEGPHESDGVQYSLTPFVGVRDAKPEGSGE